MLFILAGNGRGPLAACSADFFLTAVTFSLSSAGTALPGLTSFFLFPLASTKRVKHTEGFNSEGLMVKE